MPATTRPPQYRQPGAPPRDPARPARGQGTAPCRRAADQTGHERSGTEAPAGHRRFWPPRGLWRNGTALAAGGAAFLVLMYGGYEHHWPWTGIDGKTATLWDWLHLLLLPIAVMIVPIWTRQRKDLDWRHKAAGMTIVTAFAAVVLAGYLTPWPWTGFPGNTLWDWLGLLALPLAVALIPVIRELHAKWQRRDWLIVIAALLLFLMPVLGGYLGNWTWTGFRGNTLWDWLHLLILPLLVPTVVIPALKPLATPESEAEPEPSTASADPDTASADPDTAPAHAGPAQQDTAPARAAARQDRARLPRWAFPAALAAAALAGAAVSITLAGQAAGTPPPALIQGSPGHDTTPSSGVSGGSSPASPAPAPPASTTGPAATAPPSTIPGRASSSPAATPTPAATTPGRASPTPAATTPGRARPTASTPPSAVPSAAPAVPVPGTERPGLPASPAAAP